MSTTEYLQDFNTIFELSCGHWKTSILRTIVSLGFLDIIEEKANKGPVLATEVASLCETDKDFTYRVLRAATTLGLVTEHQTPQRSFTVARLGCALLKNRQNSARDIVLWEGSKELCKVWLELETAVKTGKKVTDDVFGGDLFQFIARPNPESRQFLKTFQAAMTAGSNFEKSAILQSFDFSSYESICDIGAGEGTLLKAILRKDAHLQGTISDLPNVIEETVIIEEDLRDRCRKESCDFFHSVPRSHDLYILKRVLHDWDDDKSVQILKTVNDCSPSHAKLLLLDCVILDSDTSSVGKLMDLHMGICNNGKERTEEEWKKLLMNSGWNYLGLKNTTSHICGIMANKD
ncbi:hypothetical protein GpartN1_g7528.t1 [Galdieria partita]|uniref:O-methyltransferase domain-containing protein n=1 Tax=Galdieria partita TaxID=83374 RepID=A0A9C7Q5I2_9RHOD|nr:hypothetical protein GpartN1_g7528.t1 [Galdieria partita]